MPRDSVIITDSRGKSLQDLMWPANAKRHSLQVSMLIHKIKGARLRTLADAAISFVGDFPTYNVYIVGGVCDITWKHPITKEIRFLHKDQEALTSHIISIIDEIDKRMHGCCPNTKFIICPLVGVNVSAYIPHIADKTPGLQDIITGAVTDINQHILVVNKRRQYRMPHLSTPVHTWRHGRFYHHLEQLATDGIHLSDGLKKIWADQLVKAIEQN